MKQEKDLNSVMVGYDSAQQDSVNHPAHYLTEKGIEAIDVIEAFTADLNGIDAFCTGNALKYLCRWKYKNGVEDLEKAAWYINKLIDTHTATKKL